MTDNSNSRKKKFMCIYGVILDSSPTPKQIRDAMLNCFREAHREALEKDFEMGKMSSKSDFKKYEHSYTEFILRQMFEQAGGDFDHPTKQALKRVISSLSQFSTHFRDKEIVDKHKKEFMKLLREL